MMIHVARYLEARRLQLARDRFWQININGVSGHGYAD